MTNQEVIALITNEELKIVLSYVIDSCQGELSGYLQRDCDEGKDLLEINVYSKFFTKKQLDLLFEYAFYGESVYYNKRMEKMCVNIEVVVNKAV